MSTAVVGRPAGARPARADAPVAELFRTHRLGMVRLALLLVDDRETAEDVVQEAFAALHRRWGALESSEAAIAYLRTCVVNGSRSVLRRRRVVRLHWRREDGVTAEPADTHALLADEHQQVLRAVAKLPRRQREVIVLRYWSGLSEADIAATLGISPGAVKSTASRARDALASLLTEEGLS